MNEFIHTFSVIRYFSAQEHSDFKNTYGSNYFFNSDNHRFVMSKYADNGLRMEVKKRGDQERKYDPLHRKYKAKIIITPHKLLNPGKNMGKLISHADIEAACNRLKSIIAEIEAESGTNLWQDVELHRVDITKDVVTPSDLYSAEIIKASKQAVYKCGYKVFKPQESEDYNPEWSTEDSTLFYSHSQEIEAKIYNKLHDLSEMERIDYVKYGLIRFELSLKRTRLIDSYGIGNPLSLGELPNLLCRITDDGAILLDKYIVQTLYPGAMLSRSVLRKYLQFEYGNKEKRIEKMWGYSSWVTKMPPKYHNLYDAAESKIANRRKCFKALSVSPVYVSGKCPYIPSFSDLLNGTVDQWLLNFAWQATKRKRKELVYWNFN